MFPFVEFEGVAAASGQYVSYSEAREPFARARWRLGEGFAIDYARRKSLAFLGVVGLGMMVQPTVGAALGFALHFHGLAGSVLALELEAAGEEVSIVAADMIGDQDLLRFWHVDHLVTIAHLLMQLPGGTVRPLRLEFEQELPPDTRRALAFTLQRPVVSPAHRTRLVYSAASLETPLGYPDLAAGAQWRMTAEREQAALSRASVDSPLSRMISAEGKLVSRRDVARRLGVSERSVDRLLAREGVRFSELTEARRLELAKSLLSAGSTVDEAAERVGYSDARAFRRAFKRMAGIRPIDFKTSGVP